MTTVKHGIYPKAAKVELLPIESSDPPIKPRMVILHVAGSKTPNGLFNWFLSLQDTTHVEAHFLVKKNGAIEQYRSIYVQADANVAANDFAVSIETEGLGNGKWSKKQLASLKNLILWLHREAGIPLHLARAWNGEGVGYHSQFTQWLITPKSCPGPKRIVQIHKVLRPWLIKQRETIEKAQKAKLVSKTKAEISTSVAKKAPAKKTAAKKTAKKPPAKKSN